MSVASFSELTTFDVRVLKIKTYTGKRGKTYTVRWDVAGRRHQQTFKTTALADSFRSELLSAMNRGEPFDIHSGNPASQRRPDQQYSWYQHICAYVDMKWPSAAGKTRQGIADALATVTPALLATDRGAPDNDLLRAAVYQWAGQAPRRAAGDVPAELERSVRWLERNTLPLTALADRATARGALDALTRRKDGTAAGATTINRKRAVLFNVLEYAVELGYFDANPLRAVKWRAPKTAEAVDPRVVVNPTQAAALLDAVAAQGETGRRLKAFFGVMYYSALRPGEAAALTETSLQLSDAGWGQLLLADSAPATGASWSDTGTRRDKRGLKHRARKEVRPVPCPPPLVAMLRRHLDEFGTQPDGRLFAGVRGGPISESTYGRVWQKARAAALGEQLAATPLAGRPYDLRHAAVSTWLNAGVDAPRVAEWAGHSVAVLLRIYTKCIYGQDEAARTRIELVLGGGRRRLDQSGTSPVA